MEDARWEAVTRLARTQGGLITRRQAIGTGYAEHHWDRLVTTRSVSQLQRGLYQLAHPDGECPRDLQAALLFCGEGAVASHRSAALLHQMWGVDGFPLEVTVPRRLTALPPSVVTYRSAVPDTDRCRISGLSVTTPARTLLDLASKVDTVTLATLLESARRRDKKLVATLRRRLVESPSFPEVTRTLGTLLSDCEARKRGFDSPFEIQFWHRWPYTGLPMPVPQHEVRDRHGAMYVDFAWPKERVAVETQGYETRRTEVSFDRDARRTARLVALGWLVIPVTYAMFRDDFFGGVLRAVGRNLTARRRGG